jgi:hypothetical protein
MNDDVVKLQLQLASAGNNQCCAPRHDACGCEDNAAMMQFHHSLVRFNEQAAQQANRDMEAASSVSKAFSAQLLKLTSEITSNSPTKGA